MLNVSIILEDTHQELIKKLSNLISLLTYRIAFAPAEKLYWIGLLFTFKNSDLGVISGGSKGSQC